MPLLVAEAPAQQVILFSADATPVHAQLFIANGDGTDERALLPPTGMDYSPSFSADGKWIVFTSERNGSADIYRVHADGAGLERLTSIPPTTIRRYSRRTARRWRLSPRATPAEPTSGCSILHRVGLGS
jgi:Tol biopolymer transport system component